MTRLLFKRIDGGGFMLVGFRGNVAVRRQPGIYVPNGLMDIFKPKARARSAGRPYEPATSVFVMMLGDPSEKFEARVARVGVQQYIIHVPKKNLDVFVPGVECVVTLTGCDDCGLVCRTSENDP